VQNVKCRIYNILGQLVREIDSRSPMNSGDRLHGNDNIGNSIYWDGRDNAGCEVASGVYFYEVSGEGVKKMVVLR
jgi:flagellar hook assembly protein FlgD